MNMCSFFEKLSRLPANEDCLLTANFRLTRYELLDKASQLRNRHPDLLGKKIALSDFSPLQLIVALIAFDGVVRSMLIIPSSLDEKTKKNVIDAANCEYLFEKDNNLQSLKISESKFKNKITSWQLATSGTTGTPKIIDHNLKSLTHSVKYKSEKCGLFRWGLMYDPSRFAGLQVVLQALLGGSPLALPINNSFDEQVKSLLLNNVNALSATPSLWRKLLMNGAVNKLNLKQITLGGEIVEQSLIESLSKYFPDSRIVHIYASTEAGTGFSVKDGLAGFPYEWVGNINAPVLLKIGPNNTLLIKPIEKPGGKEVSKRENAEGYLDTGDLVKVEKGRVYFCGRESGVINIGGNKVHPEEIESIIREVKGVINVRVFAKKNSIMGQLVSAEIMCDKEMEENGMRKKLQRYCRENLEAWQCPMKFAFVDEIETTKAGKVKRTTL